MAIFTPIVIFLFHFSTSLLPSANAQTEPDWSANAEINSSTFPRGRENIYQWPENVWAEKITQGKLHALTYPVPITGLLMPAKTTIKILGAKPGEVLFEFMKTVLSLSSDFQDFSGFWDWLGLHDYPDDGSIPFPDGVKPDYPMGVTLIERDGAKGFTLSCAACHSAELFGKTILGMTNRFPRANELFDLGARTISVVPQTIFGIMTGATPEEQKMYHQAQIHTKSIGVKKPQALGLDTSLSQVALSLAKRGQDPWATRDDDSADHPRPNMLDSMVADSKPAVWWNVKYKTRWLSDGSVQSGNPVFTNFLWNEIGRGADLEPLVDWLKQNPTIIQELTTAVFATKAPKFRDFFGESAIDITRARRGETLFTQNCAHCHGQYQKAWSLSPEDFARARSADPEVSLLDTVAVNYHSKTPVMDVGTDPGRREGMKALQDSLNPLQFSQNFSIVIEEQKGYVPAPLDGIWARYPYFHNNSIPNLCALMTEPSARPADYYAGKAIHKETDYDQECLGYPLNAPDEWKQNSLLHYDTSREGMSNSGHYERIFTTRNSSGETVERYSADQKKDLLEFLKTL